MAEAAKENRPPITLAERFDRYCAEVRDVVTRGIEHPRFELKRSATISKDQLADRLDFVKLIQGVANAHIREERFIVIGADQKEHRFYNVGNTAEFDPASLSQILSKYLDPQPCLEVFNNAKTADGESYVLIVISPDQPRPIVAVTEGKSDNRIHFAVGNIWIKKDTRLQLATRVDLDEMYETYIKQRIDEEAETRARRRFEHFRETFGAGLVAFQPTAAPVPSAELIVGTKGRLTRFAEVTISGGNDTNFRMFIEMVRERLIEKWPSLDPGMSQEVDAWTAKREEVYRDEFVPALDSIVDLGLQVIKYDASLGWVELVVNTLMESFEACRNVDRGKSNFIAVKPTAVPLARPTYDIYVALRALATYAVMRQRFRFLSAILPRYTRFVTPDDLSNVSVPLLFWPFSAVSGLPDMRDGRNKALWKAHIHTAWEQYFARAETFLAAASGLEFILDFNSYIFEGVIIPEVKALWQTLGNIGFAYIPDFWASRLDGVVPMADQFYDFLARSDEFPAELAINRAAMDLVFRKRSVQERLLFLGGFLAYLRKSQGQMMLQQNRFPYMFEWAGRLKTIVDQYLQASSAK